MNSVNILMKHVEQIMKTQQQLEQEFLQFFLELKNTLVHRVLRLNEISARDFTMAHVVLKDGK